MNQSRTGTLLHELSHIVGNINDIAQNHINGANITAAPSGTTCHGRPLARQPADGWPGLAVENAENDGFSLTDLLAEASLVAEDVSLEGLFNRWRHRPETPAPAGNSEWVSFGMEK